MKHSSKQLKGKMIIKIMETKDQRKQNLMVTKVLCCKVCGEQLKIHRRKSIQLYVYLRKNKIKINELHI